MGQFASPLPSLAVLEMYIRLIENVTQRAFPTDHDALNVMPERHKTATTMIWNHDADPTTALAILIASAHAGKPSIP